MIARWIGLLGLVVLLGGGSATASPLLDVCARLFVPEGYTIDCPVSGAGSVVVRPAAGTFAALSRLTVRAVERPIDDPDAWLRQQLTVDVSSFNAAFDELLRSPDSPLADTTVADQLESWRGALSALAGWPLNGCGEPALTGDDVREMACTWDFGPFRQYMTLRLVTRDDRVFAAEIRAMNARRLRHLTAIANSL